MVAGSALLIGAALGYFARIPQRLIAGIMAFGSGVLISALSFGASILECDEAVDHIDIGHVLGETIDGHSEKIHQCLRDSCAGEKAVAEYSGIAGQYCG